MKIKFIFTDPSSQLVITPSTERCFLNLTTSLNSIKFGTLIGPPSSGKTDTINLLAQVIYILFCFRALK